VGEADQGGYVNTSTGEIVDGSTNTMPASTFDESEWPAEP
jgi:hypothetical protein